MDAFCIRNESMATLTIKNLPDEIYAALTTKARQNRRSINNEAIISVERGLDRPDAESHRELLKRIRSNREELARKGVRLTDEILTRSRAELLERPSNAVKEMNTKKLSRKAQLKKKR